MVGTKKTILEDDDILQEQFLEETVVEPTEDWLGEELEGQLAVDVYQTKDSERFDGAYTIR